MSMTQNNQWIQVADQLPEENEFVLLNVKDSTSGQSKVICNCIYDSETSSWYGYNGDEGEKLEVVGVEVVAWMKQPLYLHM